MNLKDFSKSLTIHSYSPQKRQQMLLNWATTWECKWLEHEELKDNIIGLLEEETKLPTPLNIKDFVIATVNVIDEQEILNILDAKSQETIRSFAAEIESMNEYEILFLAFPFVSDYSIDFVRIQYVKFAKELGIEESSSDFDRVYKYFKDTKVEEFVYHSEYPGLPDKEHLLRFSHPSYYEAFRYAILLKNGSNTRQGKILQFVLSKLEKIEDAASAVAYLIAREYGRLPPNVQKLLYKMAKTKHERTAHAVANAIAHNYDNLPDNIRKLLYKLADSNKTAGAAASAVNRCFDKLPPHVREGLIRRLSKHKRYDPVWIVSQTIAIYYDKLPDDIRKLLYKLVDNNKTAGAAASAVNRCFDKLPPEQRNEMIRKLANTREVGDVSDIITKNYGKLPDEIRKLLYKLADKRIPFFGLYDPWAISNAISENFDNLPLDVICELLKRLSQDKQAAFGVAYVIAENFYKLPEDIRALFFKITDDKKVPKNVRKSGKEMERRLENAPPNVRNELLRRLDH
jgi:hypothetical protein